MTNNPNEKFYGIDLSVGSDRTINTCLILKEKMAEMLKSIYKNAQWIDGKYVISRIHSSHASLFKAKSIMSLAHSSQKQEQIQHVEGKIGKSTSL